MGIGMGILHKRVLVTGGAGFIGSHLAESLVADGNSVTVVDDLSTGRMTNLGAIKDDIEIRLGGLSRLLRSLTLEDYDIIYHLAASSSVRASIDNPWRDLQVNVMDTFRLLEQMIMCDKPPKLVNVSSGAVYGNPVKLPIEEKDQTVPISPYGVSKLAAERYVSVFCQLHGLCGVSVRLFSVYGPRQRKQVVYDLFSKLQKNPEVLRVLGNGRETRDFVYVRDAVRALVIVAQQAPAFGEVYNVASGTSISIADLAVACAKTENLQYRIEYSGSSTPGDAKRWAVDLSRMHALGYQAETDLEDGLAYTKQWLANETNRRSL